VRVVWSPVVTTTGTDVAAGSVAASVPLGPVVPTVSPPTLTGMPAVGSPPTDAVTSTGVPATGTGNRGSVATVSSPSVTVLLARTAPRSARMVTFPGVDGRVTRIRPLSSVDPTRSPSTVTVASSTGTPATVAVITTGDPVRRGPLTARVPSVSRSTVSVASSASGPPPLGSLLPETCPPDVRTVTVSAYGSVATTRPSASVCPTRSPSTVTVASTTGSPPSVTDTATVLPAAVRLSDTAGESSRAGVGVRVSSGGGWSGVCGWSGLGVSSGVDESVGLPASGGSYSSVSLVASMRWRWRSIRSLAGVGSKRTQPTSVKYTSTQAWAFMPRTR